MPCNFDLKALENDSFPVASCRVGTRSERFETGRGNSANVDGNEKQTRLSHARTLVCLFYNAFTAIYRIFIETHCSHKSGLYEAIQNAHFRFSAI